MEITILGQKLRLEILILILIVGILIGCNVVCQSCGGMSEAFTLMGSSLDYRMGAGVQNSFEQGSMHKDSDAGQNPLANLENNVGGPVPPKGMTMFDSNRFTPECCPATYTNSVGCACISPEQMNFLNERGGNRTMPSQF